MSAERPLLSDVGRRLRLPADWRDRLGFHRPDALAWRLLALTFISMPFVVRTLQPVIEALEREVEEAAATLGAGRMKTFVSVIAPTILPTLITGFALSFARAVGEYGSVVFISSNIPFQTEIAPLVIITALESYEYNSAMSIAVVLLGVSFAMLVVINLLEKWSRRYQA